MAMVKITNGDVTTFVSRGAYESQYKDLGFVIAGDLPFEEKYDDNYGDNDESFDSSSDDYVADGETDATDDFADLLEKPISQWSKNEVRDFAHAKSIDIKGTKNVNEAKDVIKEYLEDLQRG